VKPSEEWQKWEPHGSQAKHKDPWQDFQEPQKEWRDYARLQGHKRFEFLVSVNRLIDFFKRRK